MKNKKVLKIMISLFIAIILISPNSVDAKKACKELDAKKTCSKRGDCSWNTKTKECSNKSCTKITKKSDCDGSRCSWDSGKCVKKSTGTLDSKKDMSKLSNLQFCSKTAVIWQIVGWIILIVKIVIPILLIILAIVDLSKAILAGKDDTVMGAIKSLMWRAISAIIIFFIPTIVTLLMGLIINFNESGAEKDFNVCKTCIINPSSCDTNKDASKQK